MVFTGCAPFGSDASDARMSASAASSESSRQSITNFERRTIERYSIFEATY